MHVLDDLFLRIIFAFLFCFSFLFLICLNSCFSPTPQPLLIDAYSPWPIPVLCLWKLQRMTNQEVWKKSLGKNENKVTSFVVSTPSSPPAVIWELEHFWFFTLWGTGKLYIFSPCVFSFIMMKNKYFHSVRLRFGAENSAFAKTLLWNVRAPLCWGGKGV